MKKYFILAVISLIIHTLSTAQSLTGIVINENKEPLVGATLQWAGTQIGVFAGADGFFSIDRIAATNLLVISYVGYENDTLEIEPADKDLLILFAKGVSIDEIVVTAKERSNFASTLKTHNLETITSGELKKAACCNLSESFETNGSVNVMYSDAVTGAKEIEMLGLRGVYSQMQVENRPTMRGLSYPFGLEYIPGTWVENIGIAKGASSVANGNEGVAGTINVELIKPCSTEKLFVNVFGNHLGRKELNVHINQRLNDKWTTGLLLHGNHFGRELDSNADNFLDMPKKEMLNGLFRAFYAGEQWRGQINLHGIKSELSGGQTGFDDAPQTRYGFRLATDRVEAFGKLAYLGFSNPFASVGLITSAAWHENTGFFGRNDYDATQRSFYTNLLFENIFRTSDQHYKLGISYVYEDYKETFAGGNYDFLESVVGAFGEYDFVRKRTVERGAAVVERTFGVVGGLRADYHNQFGWLIAPRLSAKYNLDENTVFRLNAGRGYRTARVLAENISALTSARQVRITEDLDVEEAWNFGANFTKNFKVGGREWSISTDFYSTHFVNQIVMDREASDAEIQFYNLNGRSFANSFLATLLFPVTDFMEWKFAYKFNDVRVTYGEDLLQAPLLAPHRGLVTLGLNTPDETWKFHTTLQLVGRQRLLPLNHDNHSIEGHESLALYQLTGITPRFATLAAQINKTVGKWEFYIGGENLTNYMQHHPIIGVSDPFNEDAGMPVFDASQIYAPIMGRVFYGGIRFTLK